MADERKKWSALEMKRSLIAKGSQLADDADDTLEEWADALADKSNTWERMAWMALACLAVGVLIGWWYFSGTGCPSLAPQPQAAVVETHALPAAVPMMDGTLTATELKVIVAGDKVLCEAHKPHRGK